jgi:hypothetical protein
MFCFLPGVIVEQLVLHSLPIIPERTTYVAINVVSDLLWIPLGMIPAGMLSLAYRHFFERGD